MGYVRRCDSGPAICGITATRVRTEFRVHDAGFRVNGDEWMERLFTGARWTEGPAYLPAGRYLVFSDIPDDRVLRWDETTGEVGVFRAPSHFANGHTVDREGRLLTCEQGARRVTRTEHDGSVTVLADRYGGCRLNSPNDLVVAADGAVWFTDPSYGIDSDYEGGRADSEIGACHVYRIDPWSGEVWAVATDFTRPNGLAFSPDQALLYVVESRASPSHIREFAVAPDGTLSGGRVLAYCNAGSFDGIRLDAQGRIWAAAHDGVHCLAPDGTLLATLAVPEIVSNLTFGGWRGNHLFITATSSVYALRLSVNGAVRPGTSRPTASPTVGAGTDDHR